MSAPAVVAAPLLVSRFDAAALAGVAIATWDRLVAAGKTPAPVRVGGCVRFRRADVERWIALGCPDRAGFESAAAE